MFIKSQQLLSLLHDKLRKLLILRDLQNDKNLSLSYVFKIQFIMNVRCNDSHLFIGGQ